MNCQNCDAPVLAADERCEKCGAKLLHRRVFLGAPKAAEFTLTAEEPALDPEPAPKVDDWQIEPEFRFAASRDMSPSGESAPDARWGGFFRRLAAFIVDLVAIGLLCALMGLTTYIAYKVGLAAHGRAVALENAGPLMLFLTFGWAFLATAYFVVFHGMDGKTIGKSLLGMRVVSAGLAPVGFRQAFLRCLALAVVTAPLGIGVLWILFSREKRGWHDRIARTWVIRD